MASIPPAKLKAFLSTIKETLLEPKDTAATADHTSASVPSSSESSLPIHVKVLFSLECAQRGVLVDYESSDWSTIFETVRATAGKALVQDDNIPKPLLSGLSVVQGRIAEAMARLITTEHQSTSSTLSLDTKTLPAALERTQHVQDRRLECLLQLVQAIHEGPNSKLTTQEQQQLCLLLAEGCYYRATDFSPDAPPLWKRIVDLHVDVSASQTTTCFDNWKAVVAMEHMQSIAASKGNFKRVQELRVVLAENITSVADDVSGSNSSGSSALATFFGQTFVQSHRPIEPYSLLEASQKASQYLQQQQQQQQQSLDAAAADDVDEFLRFRSTLLALRIALMREDAVIQQVADADYTAAKNRSATSSKKELLQQARQRYLANCAATASSATNDDDDSNLRSHAMTLRDAVVALQESSKLGEITSANDVDTSLVKFRTRQAYQTLERYLVRQHEQGKALASKLFKKQQAQSSELLKSLWKDLQGFVVPILEEVSRLVSLASGPDVTTNDKATLKDWVQTVSTEQYSFLQQTVLMLVCTEWMLTGFDSYTSLISLDQWRLAQDVLQIMLFKERESLNAVSQGGVIQSNSNLNDVCRKMECAFRSARAWVYLCATPVDRLATREIVKDSVSQLDDTSIFGDSVSEFGISYLEFLVCWSGLTNDSWSFCVSSEARNVVSKAKHCAETAAQAWGRALLPYEKAILDVASADAEIGTSNGGLLEDAKLEYSRNRNDLSHERGDDDNSTTLRRLLNCKCIFGLSNLILQEDDSNIQGKMEADIRSELASVEAIVAAELRGPLYLWRWPDVTMSAAQYHVAAGRQLLADILLRNKRSTEAQSLLEQAVKDSPSDPTALFSLGAFHLRMLFFAEMGENEATDRSKLAQAYLLRSAKADSSRASPFALLGYWYEHSSDWARAIGCYSKALLIDRSHPVAGRGIMRLKSMDTIKLILDNATTEASPVNGWAWHALGEYKKQTEGNDDLAIVSLVTALRCRDITYPKADSLAYFYSDPHHPTPPGSEAFVAVSVELAACYRRAGRYTASIRCFESAIAAAGGSVSSQVLCSCAQVEFELGLFDEAAEKFAKASHMNVNDMHHMASYGLGLALLAIARRDLQDGKAGAAMDVIRRAIECCTIFDDRMACSLKLVGDLYSFAANLPPDVIPLNDSDVTDSLANQLRFVSEGVEYYCKAEQVDDASISTEDRAILSASLLSDIGCNLLSQAQLVTHAAGKGLGIPSSDADSLFLLAEESFTQALNIHAEYAPAWCGLGCSVRRKDPLLSQHAFCRSIELDKLSPEAYANLSFLYTVNNLPVPSQQMSDAVTKVADTPFMWINRALLADHRATQEEPSTGDDLLRQASDAYRAALQVSTTSTAKEGLALTCRIGTNTQRSQSEMRHLLSEYLQLTGRANIPARIFHGVSVRELGRECHEGESKDEIVDGLLKLQTLTEYASEALKSLDVDAITTSLSETKLECDTDGSNFQSRPVIARMVFYHPDRGDYWLQMAKTLLKQRNPSTEQRRNAQRALARARRILADDSNRGMAKADDLSDALALAYLLPQLLDDAPTEEDPALSIQKALFLNPENVFARQLLR